MSAGGVTTSAGGGVMTSAGGVTTSAGGGVITSSGGGVMTSTGGEITSGQEGRAEHLPGKGGGRMAAGTVAGGAFELVELAGRKQCVELVQPVFRDMSTHCL